MKTDVLIIGSGIAGLSLAIKLASAFPHRTITIVTKKDILESNTNLAQGGIAVALDDKSDSFDRHIEDTLKAGDGCCDRLVVEKVVTDAPERLRDLSSWGIEFDRQINGETDLGKEGGHSANRIVHHKDVTGNFVAEGLLEFAGTLGNIKLMPHHFAIDLLNRRDGNSGALTCIGAVVLDVIGNRRRNISARVTVLATGGAGQVYENTTNPLIATGDGIAMAWRAGAEIRDMEFIQFHPTAFYSAEDNPCFLISEAVRGFGGYLRSKSGERFVFKYDHRGELASRDVVSKAIHHEMIKDGEKAVYLDCRHIEPALFKEHFPNIFEHCLSKGFNISNMILPVAPAAHYVCGGIVTDLNGRTSIHHLYACGECARTGLHGANRLASNSLLEALVFANQIFLDIKTTIPDIDMPMRMPVWHRRYRAQSRSGWMMQKRKEVRKLMSRHAGIVRSTSLLLEAQQELSLISAQLEELFSVCERDVESCEFRNIVQVAQLIIAHSLARNENRGTFHNIDLVK